MKSKNIEAPKLSIEVDVIAKYIAVGIFPFFQGF